MDRFSLDKIKEFEKFESGLESISEDSNAYLLGNEDFKMKDSFFESNKKAIERFIQIAKKEKISNRVLKVNGALRGDRTVGIVDSTRGNDISVNRDVYDFLEEKIGDTIDKNITNIRQFIGMYISNHMADMSTRGPGKRLIWIEDEAYFKASGVDKNIVIEAIKKSEYINPSWEIATKPINVLMCFEIFHLWNHMTSKDKAILEDKDKYKTSSIYLIDLIFTIRFYSSLNSKYFPHEVDEDLMTATIESLSDRFTIKEMKNIFEFLEYFAYTNIENTIALMENPSDFNMTYFMDNLNGRINTTIKTIANNYYERHDRGDTVKTEKIQGTGEDGETFLNVSESVSADIESIVRKIAIKLSSDSTVIDRLLDIACKETSIGKAKMKATMQGMIDDDKDLVVDLIRKIIVYYIGYLKKDKKSIHSISFISIMKKTYNVSNTKDQGLIDIKEALHVLMQRNSKEYLKTSRVATLSNMKACCFYYWLLYTNEKAE